MNNLQFLIRKLRCADLNECRKPFLFAIYSTICRKIFTNCGQWTWLLDQKGKSALNLLSRWWGGGYIESDDGESFGHVRLVSMSMSLVWALVTISPHFWYPNAQDCRYYTTYCTELHIVTKTCNPQGNHRFSTRWSH